MLTVGSLFAGIGGIDLGLERTGGFKTIWQVEKDDYARRVLAKHWPDVRRWDDVRTFPPEPVDEWRVDLICGGFPCQDISHAGKRVGIDGERSGLWSEFARTIHLLRPKFVLVENVPALTVRGFGRVLGDLASLGFDAEWDCVGADFMGATQHRERVWILAYAHDAGPQGPIWAGQQDSAWPAWEAARCQSVRPDRGPWPPGPRAVSAIPRMADGPSHRMDRLRGLGNAVVPQLAEWIGRRILAAEAGMNSGQ